MLKKLNNVARLLALAVAAQAASADVIDNVAFDTTSLVGHPAGPFYVEVALTDGDGFGDANNTATLSNFNFGGGSALGSPIVVGGASGNFGTGISITDSSFLSLFIGEFAPGLQLSFSLDLTTNDDLGGIPDGLTFFLLDNSGVPLPTLAPIGDYFFSVAIGSNPAFTEYASDPSRPPSVGPPVSIPAPTITSSTPEPSTVYLLGGALLILVIARNCLSGRC